MSNLLDHEDVVQIGIMLQPFAGYVMDLIGLKLGFGLFAIAWALITMLHGFATNWQILAALRGLMGFAEGSAQPGGMKAVAEWFPADDRRRLLLSIGTSLGSMLAAPLVTWAILFHSWRLALAAVAGGLALGVGGTVVKFYSSPKDHFRNPPRSTDSQYVLPCAMFVHTFDYNILVLPANASLSSTALHRYA